MAPLAPLVFLIDDDPAVRAALSLSLEAAGYSVAAYGDAQQFLDTYRPAQPGCLLLDVQLPGLGGLALQDRLAALGISIPIVFISGHGDIPTSVKAIKAGAVDFLEKPFRRPVLLERVREALARDAAARTEREQRAVTVSRVSRLTSRELQVLDLVVAGNSSKQIARQLNVSHRTVETYRSRIMEKLEATSLPELVTKALTFRICESPV